VDRAGTRILFGSNWREHVEVDSGVDTYVVDFRSIVGVAGDGGELPRKTRLEQNYPNPFNPTTTIEFALFRSAYVSLKVYSFLGAQVATLLSGVRSAGMHSVRWDASRLPSGVYFCRMEVGGLIDTKKLLLLR